MGILRRSRNIPNFLKNDRIFDLITIMLTVTKNSELFISILLKMWISVWTIRALASTFLGLNKCQWYYISLYSVCRKLVKEGGQKFSKYCQRCLWIPPYKNRLYLISYSFEKGMTKEGSVKNWWHLLWMVPI